MDDLLDEVCGQIADLPLDEKIAALNEIRCRLHEISPFRSEPVDCVLWVSADDVEPNDYNPNQVASPEMALLETSIDHDGYTQPVVVWQQEGKFGVVDGEHRSRVGKESSQIRQRVHGYLPVAVIQNTEKGDRMSATIRHNRARGVHKVMGMGEIVRLLVREGWEDDHIAEELGMSAEEILRLKQTQGIAKIIKGPVYSQSWEIEK